MDRRQDQVVLVEVRRAREISGDCRWIERKLREKLIARRELQRESLELDQVAETHVCRVVHAFEVRLEPFARARDLPLPWPLGHGEADHQLSERVPRLGERPPARLLRFGEAGCTITEGAPRKP